MNASPSFSNLLAQPGSSAPPDGSPDPSGGVTLNDRAMQAALSNPIQQARVAKEQARVALQGLAQQFAEADDVQ